MDKNAIKKYAVWARRELISRVSQKAYQYGIREDDIVDANADSIDGKLLTDSEKKERQALIAQLKKKGFEQVMEEVAYTWFNRFSALRFMEVNGYLPTHVRVFTDDENNFKPQIITEAIHMELDGLDMNKVYAYVEADNKDELFKYLLITQCNALNKILPGMFQRIADYTELLFPDNLLREGSVIEQMIALIPEDDWKDAVQIIGWLYQYYNSEPKGTVFANLKKNIKITKENIPAATQLFTPDWIVRYMVENSLGRLWLEGHPDDKLKAKWNYYLDEAEQEADVQAQLAKIREEYKTIKPEEIKVMDCCMGSGHILVYAFDVLIQIYEAYGFNQRDAAKSIVENNIFGLDIDERAAQMAYFAVMIKARQYDRRFFNREAQPHVYAIRESNHLDSFCVDYFVNGDVKLKADIQTLIDEMYDAKEYGSILNITNVDFDAIYTRFDEIKDEVSIYRKLVLNDLLPFVQVAQAIAQKYDVVVTNPPYMGNGGFTAGLSDYSKKYYADSKNDLYSIMIERCADFSKEQRFVSMITMQSWLNAPTFKSFRKKIFSNFRFCSINNMGSRGFDEIQGEKVKNVIFVFTKKTITNWIPMFVDLTSVSGENEKRKLYIKKENRYSFSKQQDFLKHEQCLAIYKTRHVDDIYSPALQIRNICEVRRCIATGNDEVFIRCWFEIEAGKVHCSSKGVSSKWFFIANGGEHRRWYGNIVNVLNWENEGEALREFNDRTKKSTLRNVQFMFKDGLSYTYTSMGSGVFNARLLKNTMASIGVGPVMVECKNKYYVLAYVNSAPFRWYWDTMYGKVSTFETGNVGRIVFKYENVDSVVVRSKDCVEIAKSDWDSFETSWDFAKHPMMRSCSTVAEAYAVWEAECSDRFNQLKANDEELNRIFIDIYGLQDELTPDVEDKDVTVRKADLGRDIRSFVSYAVGCMFGRYSLDVDGLAYAGGDWDVSMYRSYPADADNIIPICDDEYFPDDIVGCFVKFIETVYGADTLEENLKFIADALGGKGSSRDSIRNYFMNDFYNDHCKMYQKRPIYWLFDSGKKNGFKALIYMHRYQPDTIARMRTDYVHEQQERYRTAIVHLEQRINDASTSERVKLNKQLGKLKDQAIEIRTYEEKIHHFADQMIRIDLDDGVNNNYEIFKDVLANIK